MAAIERAYGLRLDDMRFGLLGSWLLVFALVAASLAAGYFPFRHPEWGAPTRWLLGAVTSLAFFASVLVPLENWMYSDTLAGPCQATGEQLAERLLRLLRVRLRALGAFAVVFSPPRPSSALSAPSAVLPQRRPNTSHSTRSVSPPRTTNIRAATHH